MTENWTLEKNIAFLSKLDEHREEAHLYNIFHSFTNISLHVQKPQNKKRPSNLL